MKVCGKCQLIKNITNFGYYKLADDELQTYCKSCAAQYRKDRADTNYELLKRYLSDKNCADCKCSDVVVLEFDHLDNKRYVISRICRTHSWASIYKEIQKCEIVCVNCHRKRTYKRAGQLKSKWS